VPLSFSFNRPPVGEPHMNLASIGVEYAHGDGGRRPIRIDNKLDRTRNVSCVGAPFTEDLRRSVQELYSVLHSQRSAASSLRSSIRVAVSTPTRLPVMRATISATRRQCAGVRPACVVPSGRTTSR
jgi:hypothetical protein